MKLFLTFCLLMGVSFIGYGQETPPDTLRLELKTGEKIIIIGKDWGNIKRTKIDSLISKALVSVKDSVKEMRPVKTDTIRANRPRVLPKWKPFVLYPNISAGLIKNKLSPAMGLSIDFAPQRRDYIKKWGMYTFINLGVNLNYLFEKDAAGNHTYTNIFVEASIGNRINNRINTQYHFDEFSFGLGYLARNAGDYFGKHTFKLFGSIVPSHSFIRIKPEIYITDNFKKLFPGMGVGARFW